MDKTPTTPLEALTQLVKALDGGFDTIVERALTEARKVIDPSKEEREVLVLKVGRLFQEAGLKGYSKYLLCAGVQMLVLQDELRIGWRGRIPHETLEHPEGLTWCAEVLMKNEIPFKYQAATDTIAMLIVKLPSGA